MSDVAFRKIGNQVLLRGQLSGGTDEVAFTLPEGFRPTFDSVLLVATEQGPANATIRSDGSVLLPIDKGWVSLDGVTFLVD